MKQRITYLVLEADEFHPDQLTVQDASFRVRNLKAAKEHRVTFGLIELPQELRSALEQWHEVHIRWASERPYSAPPPFTSRVSPGLHVLFTPQKGESQGPICQLLKDAFGQDIACDDPKEAFTKLPILSERFSMSASSQFYSYLPTLSGLVKYIQEEICKPSAKTCKDAAATLLSSSYIDIDYDAISHALIVNAFWDKATDANTWTETIALPSQQETIEIGVLNHQENPDPEDIGFEGFLTVLGQDTKPKPTRFQTPTRHYPLPAKLPQTYRAHFSHPAGLHPTFLLSLPSKRLQSPAPNCHLHTHLTLPSYLFIDKYAFTDPLTLSSLHLKSLRSISGATDLEAPDWVVPAWGSAALFEFALPSASEKEKDKEWNISIPMHLRYLPAANSSHESVPMPWPVVFWACRAEEGAKMAANPFDRVNLGYEGLFGPRTRFVHVPPAPPKVSAAEKGFTQFAGEKVKGEGTLVEWIDVPVLDLRGAGWVEVVTVGAVVVAFLGLCWALFARGGEKKVDKGKKKQ